MLIKVKGIIKSGHGVASGKCQDKRFPDGTIAMQKPFFKQLGLDLSKYFSGTLNISIHPHQYQVKTAKYTFKNVKWAPSEPAEDFSFFDCRLYLPDHTKPIDGLIYYPHPETKPEHFQAADILEVIAPPINGLNYGLQICLECDRHQIQFL